jgi:hypothetical protein
LEKNQIFSRVPLILPVSVYFSGFSKFVWAFPLKTKTGYEVVENMEKVFKQPPKTLQTDMGKEFFNKTFQLLI